MRAIKVTFRAVFRQPIGPLNPMGLKVPGAFPVELFQRGSTWTAREIATPQRNVYENLPKFASLEHARTTLDKCFQERPEPWQAWGKPPNGLTEILLTPYELADLGQGKFGWIQDEDRTHIIHAPTIPPGARIPPAACGARVNVKCFISTKANIEPSCRGCAEVWRKEYKDR